ncbi:urease subunit beta [Paenibacillus tyrfis]|uniref:Urease subunit beta n=1 Tax=Paenibacillus tyrfis TaxID=1501230 RepID=A0A081NYG1_9BACL|nr:urease subunit beta [Paenibacillus tyrfis]KEQ23484.1 urease subunit beta [Paenibacillus tyrfis]
MIPGEYILRNDDIICNAGKKSITLEVLNTGDRPIQVGSHYHFYEVNTALEFDREAAFGMRLNIPAGAAVRFEPGDSKKIELIPFAGERRVYGFNNKTEGSVNR